jgi:hypothetical protein
MNNGTVRTYLNGTRFGTIVTYANYVTTLGSVTIGRGFRHANRYFLGSIANFKVYTKTLTDAEILQNFTENRAKFGI